MTEREHVELRGFELNGELVDRAVQMARRHCSDYEIRISDGNNEGEDHPTILLPTDIDDVVIENFMEDLRWGEFPITLQFQDIYSDSPTG